MDDREAHRRARTAGRSGGSTRLRPTRSAARSAARRPTASARSGILQLGAADEGRPQVVTRPRDAIADPGRRPDPGRVADPPASRGRGLSRLPGSGWSSASDGRVEPGPQRPVARADAEADTARSRASAGRRGRTARASSASDAARLRPATTREGDRGEARRRPSAGSGEDGGGGDGGEASASSRRASRVADRRRPSQGIRPHPDRILTVVATTAFAGLFASGRWPWLLLGVRRCSASAARRRPRVLVATLADDINPVSQDYLQDQVRRARARTATTRSSSSSTRPGGLGIVDAGDREDVPRLAGAGRRLRQPRRARAPTRPAP